jgi:two-component system sensor histidine kinase AlgZ
MALVRAPHDAAPSTLFDDLRERMMQREAVDARNPWPLCSSGVMLRALLLVHGAVGLALVFVVAQPMAWLLAVGAAASVAVPATLGWLLLACVSGRWLRSRAVVWQTLMLAAAGALLAALVWRLLDAVALAPPSATGALAPALSGAALAALLLQLMRWRERARLPAATAAHLADLQTRIRPHFLFNTLNTAIALVQHDPRRAEEVLEDLSDLFRAALGALDKVTTLAEEVELSRRYLSIEQLRFGSRLNVSWNLDPNAAGARLPPLALQPLVENAVRHGIETSDRGGSIEIRTRRRRDRVLVSVTNTVPRGVAMASAWPACASGCACCTTWTPTFAAA